LVDEWRFYYYSILLMATVFVALVFIPILVTFPMEMKIVKLKAKGVDVEYCQDRWINVRQSEINKGHEWNRCNWGSFLSIIDDLHYLEELRIWGREISLYNLDYKDVTVWVCKEDRVLWLQGTTPDSYLFIYGDDF